jgi:3-isopropylmalate/(R)-2-methylmalate dehydratase small subunit
MIIQGRVWKVRDDLRATDIVSERYDELSMSKQYDECAKHVLEDIEPRFCKEMRPGDIIVAGRNFGAGHAHYYGGAIMGMKRARVGAVLAESINGFFLRVAIDFGLPAWSFPGLHALVTTGDELKMDMLAGDVTNLTTGKTAKVEGMSPIIGDIIAADGSLKWAVQRVAAAGRA